MQNSKKWIAWTTFLVMTVILWSIWFISLQGYSSDARNSKRISDISSIQSSLTVKIANWTNILSFVDENKDNKIDSTILSIWWKTSITSDYYNAWYANYSVLSMRAGDFTDPTNQSPYVVWVTTLGWWRYQIVANMEQASWSKVARVIWTYANREKKEVFCSKGENNNQVRIKTAYINMFHLYDNVIITTDKWNINTEVTRVSADGLTLWFRNEVVNPTKISLSNSESIWLIDRMDGDWKSGDNFVIDWWYNLPY